MSVKGRKSRQVKGKSVAREPTLKALFKPKHVASRNYFPSGKAWEVGRARQLPPDTLVQVPAEQEWWRRSAQGVGWISGRG